MTQLLTGFNQILNVSRQSSTVKVFTLGHQLYHQAIRTIRSQVISQQTSAIFWLRIYTKDPETAGAKKCLDKKSLIRVQRLFWSEQSQEPYAEALPLRVGLPLVNGLTTMQLLSLISTKNSFHPIMITRFTFAKIVVSCLVMSYQQLEVLN